MPPAIPGEAQKAANAADIRQSFCALICSAHASPKKFNARIPDCYAVSDLSQNLRWARPREGQICPSRCLDERVCHDVFSSPKPAAISRADEAKTRPM